MERTEGMFTAPVITSNDSKDERVINKRSREKLSDILKKQYHVPHPFVLQCLYQGCCKFYGDEDQLRKHMKDKHGVSDVALRNFNVFGLAQLYHKDYILWKDEKKILSIDNYWEKKENCIFENCLFDKHNSLKCERNHIRYYLEEVIGFEEVTELQIEVFEALSPIWKGMVLERWYYELNWNKSCGLQNVLDPKCELVKYNMNKEDEHLIAERYDEGAISKSEEEKRKIIEERKAAYPLFRFKKKENVRKEVMHERLKANYHRQNRQKFAARDERRDIQAEKCQCQGGLLT
jgi:hypothetical protein